MCAFMGHSQEPQGHEEQKGRLLQQLVLLQLKNILVRGRKFDRKGLDLPKRLFGALFLLLLNQTDAETSNLRGTFSAQTDILQMAFKPDRYTRQIYTQADYK